MLTPSKYSPAERVNKIRDLLRKNSVDCFLVPTDDAHSSEYPPESDQRREYISGFTGSAGTAVITLNEALLWTDGRYFNQAAQELDAEVWTLMKSGEEGVPKLNQWIRDNAQVKRVGYDPAVTSITFCKELNKCTADAVKGPTELIAFDKNIVDEIWDHDGCPDAPRSKVIVHPVEFAGASVQEKLVTIRESLTKENVSACVLSRLDDVAWAFNLRGSDVDCSPVFLSYALITSDTATLYVDASRLSQTAKDEMAKLDVKIKGYQDIFTDLQIRFGQATVSKPRVWLDSVANMKLYTSIGNPEKRVFIKQSPAVVPKAIKNSVELFGMKECHVEDALALSTFLAWLEEESRAEGFEGRYTEWTLAEKLDNLRQLLKDNRGLSFPTISSIGSNAAVIHYSPHPDTARAVSKDLYLVDSGGQYLNGTTDVTRTVHLGTPTEMQKDCYTRVLKGHIALAKAIFPHGTKGPQLDVLARQYLWSVGLDYRHGTGHGVGSFLMVHEGPQRISPQLEGAAADTDLVPGMVVSNEPGLYIDGEFGIRIENLVHVKSVKTKHDFGKVAYYGFEQLTLVPYCGEMTNLPLLSEEEIAWIDSYHQKVWEALAPRLQADDRLPHKDLTLRWLERNTAPMHLRV